jgi:hypothetical protein
MGAMASNEKPRGFRAVLDMLKAVGHEAFFKLVSEQFQLGRKSVITAGPKSE